MTPVNYKQIDPRWREKGYSAPGESTTIGKAGCGPTCMAMVIATLADKNVTPEDTCKWSLLKGFKALKQGTFYTYFKPQGAEYGIKVEQVNPNNLRSSVKSVATRYHQQALDAIKAGDFVIACMGPGLWTKAGHFILWYGMEGNDVLINDPASSSPERAKAPLATLQAQVKFYWIVENTKKGVKELPKLKVQATRITIEVDGVKSPALLGEDGVSYVPVRTAYKSPPAKIEWDAANEVVKVTTK